MVKEENGRRRRKCHSLNILRIEMVYYPFVIALIFMIITLFKN